jgi:hypothetical protein
MTVTPANLDQIADVIRACRTMGWRMFSFQPAAYVGDDSRWADAYRSFGADEVWREIEAGAGARLPFRAVQMGDERCNRVTWGVFAGDRYVPLLDDTDARDLAARDAFYRTAPRNFAFAARPIVAACLARAVAGHPRDALTGAAWAARFARRVGPAALTGNARPMTFVMHRFMDAGDVAEAWRLTSLGVRSDHARIRETQERLAACAYAMAHPDSDEIVPACVQHAILDPAENAHLARLLPLRSRVGRAHGAPSSESFR